MTSSKSVNLSGSLTHKRMFGAGILSELPAFIFDNLQVAKLHEA